MAADGRCVTELKETFLYQEEKRLVERSDRNNRATDRPQTDDWTGDEGFAWTNPTPINRGEPFSILSLPAVRAQNAIAECDRDWPACAHP